MIFQINSQQIIPLNCKLHIKKTVPNETVFKIVPGTGLEPASLSALAPETSVSTNFTIRAL